MGKSQRATSTTNRCRNPSTSTPMIDSKKKENTPISFFLSLVQSIRFAVFSQPQPIPIVIVSIKDIDNKSEIVRKMYVIGKGVDRSARACGAACAPCEDLWNRPLGAEMIWTIIATFLCILFV